MSKIVVQTGFGYYIDQGGHIVSKTELPAGVHDLADDLDYIEVNSRAELDAIEVYQDPADIVAAENEKKIQNKMRALAIAELIKDGELPADYQDTKL